MPLERAAGQLKLSMGLRRTGLPGNILVFKFHVPPVITVRPAEFGSAAMAISPYIRSNGLIKSATNKFQFIKQISFKA